MARVSLWFFVLAIVVCIGYVCADPIPMDSEPVDEVRSIQVRSANGLQRIDGDNFFLFVLRSFLAIPAAILGLITGAINGLGISTWPVVSFIYDVLQDVITWIISV